MQRAAAVKHSTLWTAPGTLYQQPKRVKLEAVHQPHAPSLEKKYEPAISHKICQGDMI